MHVCTTCMEAHNKQRKTKNELKSLCQRPMRSPCPLDGDKLE